MVVVEDDRESLKKTTSMTKSHEWCSKIANNEIIDDNDILWKMMKNNCNQEWQGVIENWLEMTISDWKWQKMLKGGKKSW